MDAPPIDAVPSSPGKPRFEPAGAGTSTSPEDAKVTQPADSHDVPVDPIAFRPKFVPKSQREGRSSSDMHDPKKHHNSSSKKARKTLVSFDIDKEEGLSITPDVGKDKDKKRKKKRDKQDEGDRERKRGKLNAQPLPATMEVDEELEWVEKDAPPIPSTTGAPHDLSKRPGRMKAADFM